MQIILHFLTIFRHFIAIPRYFSTPPHKKKATTPRGQSLLTYALQ